MAMSISSIVSASAAAATKTASAQASSKTTSTDPRDLNKDGVVTAASSQTTAAATPKVDLLA